MIIRFSSIGDIVLTSPVVRCIRTQWNAEVHFLTKKKFASVLEHSPYISKIFGLEGRLGEITPLLKEEKYDLVVDLHKNLRSHLIKLALGKPSVSYAKQTINKELYLKLGIYPPSGRHIIDRYLDAVKPYGINDDGLGMNFFTSNLKATQKLPDNYVALCLGATHYTKRMTEHVLKALLSKIEHSVVLLGGQDVASLGKICEEHRKHDIYNLVGKTSLDQSASILGNSRYVVSGDSAMMHIACALNKPLIAVWGSTHPIWGYYPYYGTKNKDRSVSLAQDLSCRPCTKNGKPSCPKQHFQCMQHSPEEIKAAITEVNIIAKTSY